MSRRRYIENPQRARFFRRDCLLSQHTIVRKRRVLFAATCLRFVCISINTTLAKFSLCDGYFALGYRRSFDETLTKQLRYSVNRIFGESRSSLPLICATNFAI